VVSHMVGVVGATPMLTCRKADVEGSVLVGLG